MKDLMIGTDSAVEVLETGGVGEGYPSGNEPSKWAQCGQSRVTAVLFPLDESSVYLEEVHLVSGSRVYIGRMRRTVLEGESWDDREVTTRGIMDYILCFVHDKTRKVICQVVTERVTNVEGRQRKEEWKRGGGRNLG